MRKYFVLAVIITLVLAGCEDENETGGGTLKINNQSFTEITDVIWQNVSFSNSKYVNSIVTGTNVSKSVKAGAGYIYFKRKSNQITARTSEMIVIEEGNTKEFTFIDNTLVVEANNPTNTGTLGTLQTTVVWFDDAEGAILPYYLRQDYVGYYSKFTNTGYQYYSYYAPKNGKKSIAIGATNTAMLHLKINLSEKAKLSFWYANKGSGAIFSINGVEEQNWGLDIAWSFIEFDLESGENNLVWEKKYGYVSSRGDYYYYYLSLDDILIYYTE